MSQAGEINILWQFTAKKKLKLWEFNFIHSFFRTFNPFYKKKIENNLLYKFWTILTESGHTSGDVFTYDWPIVCCKNIFFFFLGVQNSIDYWIETINLQDQHKLSAWSSYRFSSKPHERCLSLLPLNPH